MTTTPTPEQIQQWHDDATAALGGIPGGTAIQHDFVVETGRAFRAAVKACEALIAERDDARNDAAHAHRDWEIATAALKAVEAERDQALARVKESEQVKTNWMGAAERQKSIADTANRYADDLKGRAEKAEARLAACEIVEANYQEALGEAKKLKAQLDVAVEALEGMANPTHPIGAMYWEWACAALAKIKETP